MKRKRKPVAFKKLPVTVCGAGSVLCCDPPPHTHTHPPKKKKNNDMTFRSLVAQAIDEEIRSRAIEP